MLSIGGFFIAFSNGTDYMQRLGKGIQPKIKLDLLYCSEIVYRCFQKKIVEQRAKPTWLKAQELHVGYCFDPFPHYTMR